MLAADFLLKASRDSTAILFIPVYGKKDIVDLALSNVKLPAGVTRHVVSKRALGLHIDLALLISGYVHKEQEQNT